VLQGDGEAKEHVVLKMNHVKWEQKKIVRGKVVLSR